MKMIKVPSRMNYIGIFLTLKCNLDCFYCINKSSKLIRQRDLLSGGKWIKCLNELEISNGLAVTLEGGEPSLHSGFYDIIREVKHPIDMLTNLQFNIDSFIRKIRPEHLNKNRDSSYKSIRVSYHNQNQDELIDKAIRLQKAGFNIGIFSINIPEKTVDNMVMAEKARLNNIYFFIKDFLGYRENRLYGYFKYSDAMNGHKRDVICRIKELLVSPNGDVFKCHRDLYANEYSVGNITDNNFVIKDIFRPCSNYGNCNPCDVKEKTNRFLEMGSCSVEIKGVNK